MAPLQNKEKNPTSLIDHIKDWQALLDVLHYPVFVVDNEFTIVMLNKEMSILTGNIETFENKKCFQILHNSHSPVDNCPMIKTLKSGKSEQIKIYEPSHKKTFILNASPIISSGRTIGVVHSTIDVTETELPEGNNNDIIEILSRSINELKNKAMNAEKGRDAFLNMLEDVNESYNELEDLFLKLVHVMVNALDAKSPWTKGHSERVAMYAEDIAAEMVVDVDEIKNIKLAGLLHDIGKIGTYDYLLDKPGKLTREEFDIVKKHPSQGATILQEIKQLSDIIPYIKYHHEKLDGKGYPNNLKGKHIPLGARILHVADSYDSMTSDRPYRPAPGIDYALSELIKFKGTQFDHRVVEAFLKVLKKTSK